ncbi:MAG: HRDC domain-containing protein [Candidatus Cloacimonadia bacterium]
MQFHIKQIIRDFEHALARIVLYCVSEAPLTFGVRKTIRILKGAKSTFVIDQNLHQLDTYGILPTLTNEYLRTVIDVLLECGLLEVEMVSQYENRPILKLTPKGLEFLSGKDDSDVPFVETLSDKEIIQLTKEEQEFFERLRRLRLKIAVAKGLPAYTICHDTVLREIAKLKPTTPEALLTVSGIGEKFVTNYGDLFLEEIEAASGEPTKGQSHNALCPKYLEKA